MGTKRIVMTTTQHRIQAMALRERCLSEAIRMHQTTMPGNQRHPDIVKAAKAFENYVNTGKVK